MDEPELRDLIRHLGRQPGAAGRLLDAADAGADPVALTVAALIGDDPGPWIERAAQLARTTRDRQLVAIATCHLAGDAERTRMLVREHLVDHPSHPVVEWVRAASGASFNRPA